MVQQPQQSDEETKEAAEKGAKLTGGIFLVIIGIILIVFHFILIPVVGLLVGIPCLIAGIAMIMAHNRNKSEGRNARYEKR